MIKNIFVFVFFSSYVQANVFPTDTGVTSLNKDEVRNPYNYLILSPFKEEVVKKAVKLLEQRRSEILDYRKVLNIFYQINADQIASILNERKLLLGGNPDLKTISKEELNNLYENPDVKDLTDFIIANELSSKQILIVLFPFLRDQSLESSQIIEVLSSVSFEINTLLKGEDIISLFLDPSIQAEGIDLKDTASEDLVLKPRENLTIPSAEGTLKFLKYMLSMIKKSKAVYLT